MKKTVRVQRAWLEGLMDSIKRIKQSKKDHRVFAIAHLIGYASSVKYILEDNPKK